MRIIPLDRTNLAAFRQYCLDHRLEHDESYLAPECLSDEELLDPAAGPSFLLLDADGRVIGAASLMLERFKALGKGRFRILHALSPQPEHYRALLHAVLPHARDRASVYLFLPRERSEVGRILEGLGFGITRYAFLLERPAVPAAAEPTLPAGYAFRSYRPGADDAAWCGIINAAFAHLPAHIDLTPETLRRELGESIPLDGGLIMLWFAEAPVGLVRVTREEDGGRPLALIEQVAVLPAHQRRGLGRALLRKAVRLGEEAGLPLCQLSVNAENERAIALYCSEGFREKQVMLCYELKREQYAQTKRAAYPQKTCAKSPISEIRSTRSEKRFERVRNRRP